MDEDEEKTSASGIEVNKKWQSGEDRGREAYLRMKCPRFELRAR